MCHRSQRFIPGAHFRLVALLRGMHMRELILCQSVTLPPTGDGLVSKGDAGSFQASSNRLLQALADQTECLRTASRASVRLVVR